jgi:hypothetical protein
LQDVPSGDRNFHNSDGILFIGSSYELIDEILPEMSYKFEMKMLFSIIGKFKIIAHVERISETKSANAKKYHDSSEVLLDDIDTITWFKGIKLSVLEDPF